MKLSVLMPVFNEQRTLRAAIDRLLAIRLPCELELVVVDDASTDRTPHILAACQHASMIVLTHPVNRGKGAAIRTAAARASGDYVVPYDADLEYRPEDLPALLAPVLAGRATVVFGVRRFTATSPRSVFYLFGNHGISLLASLLFAVRVRDLETCFKLLPLALYRELAIRSDGFGMEAELTGKLLARGLRPAGVPISYHGRTRQQGKKITWRDGVEAVWILVRIRIRRF